MGEVIIPFRKRRVIDSADTTGGATQARLNEVKGPWVSSDADKLLETAGLPKDAVVYPMPPDSIGPLEDTDASTDPD